MTNPIDNAHDRATAAIKALADAGHRQANEHAFAVDRLRAEVEALRTQNGHLRERVADLEHRCAHSAEVLSRPDVEVVVRPVDTEAPREVARWTDGLGLPCMARVERPEPGERLAIQFSRGWVPYPGTGEIHLTESQAIAWVLDGVLL